MNIGSLGALQAINFALTMLTLPYLTRILGVTGWGTVVLVQLIINYMIWVANWGFYLGATKKVSSSRGDRRNLSSIFMATWSAQWCITVVLTLALMGGVVAIPMFREKWDLYLAASGLLLGNVLMPLWFFNGLEKIQESALMQLAVKMLSLPFIFTYVKQTDDIDTYLWISSVSSVTVGLAVSLWICHSKVVDLILPKAIEIRESITENFHLFISSLLANLNAAVVPTVLGIFVGATELGYFNLADRARSAAITILHPITHALFPRMCYLFSNEAATAMRMLRYAGGGMLLLSLMMSAFLFLFSSQIIFALGGDTFQKGSIALQLLAFSPVFTTMSAFFVHQILIPSSASRGVILGTFYTLLLNLVLVYPAVHRYGASGGASVIFINEFFLVVFLAFYIRTKKILVFVEDVGKRKIITGQSKNDKH